jgi:hypothetical protein
MSLLSETHHTSPKNHKCQQKIPSIQGSYHSPENLIYAQYILEVTHQGEIREAY